MQNYKDRAGQVGIIIFGVVVITLLWHVVSEILGSTPFEHFAPKPDGGVVKPSEIRIQTSTPTYDDNDFILYMMTTATA